MNLWLCLALCYLSYNQVQADFDVSTNNDVINAVGSRPVDLVSIFVDPNEYKTDQEKQQATYRAQQGIQEAVQIAGIACVVADENDEVYQRYFEAGHFDLVRSIYCNIANVPSTCPINQILKTEANPRFADLLISMGKFPSIKDTMRGKQEDKESTYAATTYQRLKTNFDIGTDDDKAIIEIRSRAMDYPSASDVKKKRQAAGLGDKESGLMTTLSAHILHELVHWRLLVRADNNAADFDAVINHTVIFDDDDGDKDTEVIDIIDDYDRDEYEDKDIDPLDGYGFINAAELVGNQVKDSFRNADNYRWFAVVKFWGLIFRNERSGRPYAQQTDRAWEDSVVPPGSMGQVPFPGERPPPPNRGRYEGK